VRFAKREQEPPPENYQDDAVEPEVIASQEAPRPVAVEAEKATAARESGPVHEGRKGNLRANGSCIVRGGSRA